MKGPAADNSSVSGAPDHAGVRVPPPLIYLAVFLVALGLQRLLPLPAIPKVIGFGAGPIVIAPGIAFAAWSVGLFRRAGTSLIPIKPTTALSFYEESYVPESADRIRWRSADDADPVGFIVAPARNRGYPLFGNPERGEVSATEVRRSIPQLQGIRTPLDLRSPSCFWDAGLMGREFQPPHSKKTICDKLFGLRGLDECYGSECNDQLTSLGRREVTHCAGRAIALVQLY
jgi:hypothetical protein